MLNEIKSKRNIFNQQSLANKYHIITLSLHATRCVRVLPAWNIWAYFSLYNYISVSFHYHIFDKNIAYKHIKLIFKWKLVYFLNKCFEGPQRTQRSLLWLRISDREMYKMIKLEIIKFWFWYFSYLILRYELAQWLVRTFFYRFEWIQLLLC